MKATSTPLNVKVVYRASGGRTARTGRRVSGGPRRGNRFVVLLGVINLLVACGLYLAAWQWADPELRIKLLMHTPLPGVDVQIAAEMIRPSSDQSSANPQRGAPASRASTQQAVEEQTSQATRFVASVIGWEVLTGTAVFVMALSGGALIGRFGGPRIRKALVLLAAVTLAALGWAIYRQWSQYQTLTPSQTRLYIAVGLVLMALIGFAVRRGVRGLAYGAATLLILASIGTALGLYVGVQYEAFQPSDWPLPFTPFLTLVFLGESVWGWILLPLAGRIRQ